MGTGILEFLALCEEGQNRAFTVVNATTFEKHQCLGYRVAQALKNLLVELGSAAYITTTTGEKA